MSTSRLVLVLHQQVLSIIDRLAEVHDDSTDSENENDEAEAENQQNLLRYDDLLLIEQLFGRASSLIHLFVFVLFLCQG